jgi:hypothetical protein
MSENTNEREALTLTQDEVFKLAIDAGARVIPNSHQYAVKGEITFENKYQLESLAIAINAKLQAMLAHQQKAQSESVAEALEKAARIAYESSSAHWAAKDIRALIKR